MSGYKGGLNLAVNEVIKKAMDKILSKSIALQRAGTDIVQNAYTEFSRPPIMTGKAQRSSSLKEIQPISDRKIRFVFEIAVAYAVFFVFGLGTNWKYGKRNPVDKARQKLKETIIDFIR